MVNRYIKRILAAMVLVCAAVFSASAQNGAYSGFSPYSMYGIGDLFDQGTAYNQSMGGVGIASRNTRYINVLNPAAVTARDSLSFMADFSLYQGNTLLRQGDRLSANNIFNLKDIAISFPLYRSSAMMVGIMPYSTTGYKYSMYIDDPELISQTKDVTSSAIGQGSIYKLFVAAGVTFWNRLSLGAEWIHYFGNISKEYYPATFSNATYSSMESTYNLILKGNTAQFGLQYEQPLGSDITLGVGATYTLESNVNGFISDTRLAKGAAIDTIRYRVDTLAFRDAPLKFASELGVGIALKSGQKWRAEVNYTMSDWTNTGFDSTPGLSLIGSGFTFTGAKAQALRAGFEYIPNANDVRYYYRRLAYRAGFLWKKSYFAFNNVQQETMGISLGVTLPVFRLSNGITFGVEFGRKGINIDNTVKENYINFSIGVNSYDIWFQKNRYN
jgi:hypothetical protein